MTFRQRTKLASPARLAPVLTLVAAGCSLIVPLDYVGGGGTSPSGGSSGNVATAGTGGQAGLGGSAATGGAGALGGAESTGGAGGSEGGTDQGGAPGGAGMAGDDNGGDGPSSGRGGALGGSSGSAGGGVAGTAGLAGGVGGALGGRAGRGGTGGLAGGGAGAGGCGNPDFMTDHANCGSCENACKSDEECLEGYCASSPCDGICATFSSVTLLPGQGYKRDNIGTGDVCAEVTGYDVSPEPPTFVCWSFDNPKFLELNRVTIPCTSMGEEFDVPLRLGGYCVHASPGTSEFRGFEFPD